MLWKIKIIATREQLLLLIGMKNAGLTSLKTETISLSIRNSQQGQEQYKNSDLFTIIMTNSDEEGLSYAYICRSLWCADFHQKNPKI